MCPAKEIKRQWEMDERCPAPTPGAQNTSTEVSFLGHGYVTSVGIRGLRIKGDLGSQMVLAPSFRKRGRGPKGMLR